MIDFLLEPVIQSWARRSLGFSLLNEDGEIEHLYNHAVWADNVILFASSIAMLQKMVDELSFKRRHDR